MSTQPNSIDLILPYIQGPRTIGSQAQYNTKRTELLTWLTDNGIDDIGDLIGATASTFENSVSLDNRQKGKLLSLNNRLQRGSTGMPGTDDLIRWKAFVNTCPTPPTTAQPTSTTGAATLKLPPFTSKEDSDAIEPTNMESFLSQVTQALSFLHSSTLTGDNNPTKLADIKYGPDGTTLPIQVPEKLGIIDEQLYHQLQQASGLNPAFSQFFTQETSAQPSGSKMLVTMNSALNPKEVQGLRRRTLYLTIQTILLETGGQYNATQYCQKLASYFDKLRELGEPVTYNMQLQTATVNVKSEHYQKERDDFQLEPGNANTLNAFFIALKRRECNIQYDMHSRKEGTAYNTQSSEQKKNVNNDKSQYAQRRSERWEKINAMTPEQKEKYWAICDKAAGLLPIPTPTSYHTTSQPHNISGQGC